MICVTDERFFSSPPSPMRPYDGWRLPFWRLPFGTSPIVPPLWHFELGPLESRVTFSPNHEIRELVRQSVDIVDLVGSYLQLTRKGHVNVALCPWHEDTKPSLQIDGRRQTYKCWVCNKGGDVFSFVMEREGVTFPEALRILADRAGITLPEYSSHGGDGNDTRKSLLELLEFAAEEFHRALLDLPEASGAREYLEKRGLNRSSIDRFRIGYSPQAWTWLRDRAKKRGYNETELEQAGMLVRSSAADRTFDRFRQRLMFPIRDVQGRVIAFGGRTLPGAPEDSAKYINSPETRLFTKNQHLYGLDLARHHAIKEGSLMVMEGYTDVIMAHQHGVCNAVAVLGTALGARHLQLLQRYHDRIVLILDGDDAGRRRANEVVELFMASPLDVRVCTLPEELDPCDFLVNSGGEALRVAISTSQDALDFKLSQLTKGIDVVRDTHASNQALEEMLGLVMRIPAQAAIDDGRFQLRSRQTVGLLARTFHVPAETIQARLTELRRARRTPLIPTTTLDASPTIQGMDLDLLGIMVQHSDMISEIVRSVAADQLVSELGRQLFHHFANAVDEHPEVNFNMVLGLIDDPKLKSALVDVDHLAGKHERLCKQPREVFEEILASLAQREWTQTMRHELVKLENEGLDEAEQLRAVELIVARQRSSQGIFDDHPRTGD